MNNNLIFENWRKRLEEPLWMLMFFALYCFWQMGFIYFMGPSLNIDGRTPLPISMDNVTLLIVAGYVLSIIVMIFVPHLVIMLQRSFTVIALGTALGLFFPFGTSGLTFLIYLQAFCCCFMIGFEMFLMVNFFTENCTVKHLTLAYGSCFVLIAVVQNDFVPITFPQFRIITVVALVLMLVFFFRMPSGKNAYPRYITKKDNLTSPKQLLIGSFIFAFTASVMAVSGPAIAGEIPNGVFILYLADAAACMMFYFLYKKFDLSPFRLITACMAVGCLGFLFMFAAAYIPSLATVACIFIGVGMIPCQMIPVFGVVLMKNYPSRFITPIIIALAMSAVIVQSTMVEAFRGNPTLLNLVYALIVAALVIFYLQIEPILLYSSGKRVFNTTAPSEEERTAEKIEDCAANKEESEPLSYVLTQLTRRELEVVDLICHGYSNGDIAKVLIISEHTVKDHTKNIYRKLNVHSRYELTSLVSRLKADISD